MLGYTQWYRKITVSVPNRGKKEKVIDWWAYCKILRFTPLIIWFSRFSRDPCSVQAHFLFSINYWSLQISESSFPSSEGCNFIYFCFLGSCPNQNSLFVHILFVIFLVFGWRSDGIMFLLPQVMWTALVWGLEPIFRTTPLCMWQSPI